MLLLLLLLPPPRNMSSVRLEVVLRVRRLGSPRPFDCDIIVMVSDSRRLRHKSGRRWVNPGQTPSLNAAQAEFFLYIKR